LRPAIVGTASSSCHGEQKRWLSWSALGRSRRPPQEERVCPESASNTAMIRSSPALAHSEGAARVVRQGAAQKPVAVRYCDRARSPSLQEPCSRSLR
jgi:hypothetical protein